MTITRAAEMLLGGETEKAPAAKSPIRWKPLQFWQLTIVHPDADEDHVLPAELPPTHVAALLRLIVATKMKSAEIVESFIAGRYPSASFTISERSFGEDHLLMECATDALTVFAVRQTAPAIRH